MLTEHGHFVWMPTTVLPSVSVTSSPMSTSQMGLRISLFHSLLFAWRPTELPSLLRLSDTPFNILCIALSVVGCFCNVAITNGAAESVCVCKSLSNSYRLFRRSRLSSRSYWSVYGSIFKFLRNLSTFFHNGGLYCGVQDPNFSSSPSTLVTCCFKSLIHPKR